MRQVDAGIGGQLRELADADLREREPAQRLVVVTGAQRDGGFKRTAKARKVIAGDVGSSVEDVLVQGGGLLALSYSRAAESEADRRSVELMAKAGYDPTAIARFFALLEEKLGDTSDTNLLSTHPGTPRRKKDITDYARIISGQSDPDLQ